jgi:hypothetical protein
MMNHAPDTAGDGAPPPGAEPRRRSFIAGAVGLSLLVLGAGIGAGCGSSSSTTSSRTGAANSAPPPKPSALPWKTAGRRTSSGSRTKPLATPRSANATFSVGSGMTVSIVGGGGAVDLSSGSNCTNNETNTTFKTRGNNEPHGFGFDSKGSGGCATQASWSYFKVSVKDPGGKEVGHGESMWLGQGSWVDSYYAACDQAHQGEQPKPWVGLKCDRTSDSELKITRP